MLCGLLVDHKEKVMLPSNPLEVKRKEREDKLVGGWLKEENFEKDGIELYCTQALHDAAELIYQQLVNECLSDMLLSWYFIVSTILKSIIEAFYILFYTFTLTFKGKNM